MVAKSEALQKSSKKTCWAWHSFSIFPCTTIKLEVDGYQSFNLFNWFLWFPLNYLFSAPWEIIRKFCPINTCSSACENFWAGPQFEIKLSFLFYALPFLWFIRFQQNFEETQVVSIREKNQRHISPLCLLKHIILHHFFYWLTSKTILSYDPWHAQIKFYSFLTNPSSLVLWFSILRLVTLS